MDISFGILFGNPRFIVAEEREAQSSQEEQGLKPR
jgi:hypothetical protein